jgi:hypothetical protein
MLFTWDTTNLCIVFPSWRITGTLSLIVSLLAVVALTAGYEAIREVSRRYEERLEKNVREAPRKFFFQFPKVGSTVFAHGLVFWVIILLRTLLTHTFLRALQRRRRTELTSHYYYYGRQCRCGGREEGQDGQGGAVWRAGVLFVLHHVSPTGSAYLSTHVAS